MSATRAGGVDGRLRRGRGSTGCPVCCRHRGPRIRSAGPGGGGARSVAGPGGGGARSVAGLAGEARHPSPVAAPLRCRSLRSNGMAHPGRRDRLVASAWPVGAVPVVGAMPGAGMTPPVGAMPVAGVRSIAPLLGRVDPGRRPSSYSPLPLGSVGDRPGPTGGRPEVGPRPPAVSGRSPQLSPVSASGVATR